MPAPLVALETTLLVHGVPRESAGSLARDLASIVRGHGARPAFVGIVGGRPIVGLSDDELEVLLTAPSVPKANTSNLGLFVHRQQHAATTVSTTVELAAGAGVRLFATGGLGGIHRGYGSRLDISADLAALARYPVAVVCSGCKSILDVGATREALETLGVPVVGFRTDRFPEFYLRGREIHLDGRFEEPGDLAAYIQEELARTGRGIVIANPIPPENEIALDDFDAWLTEANRRVGATKGRDVTPAILGALHEISNGATLRANIALVKANASLAARLAALLRAGPG